MADDVEVALLRHVAGDYDRVLGQLCMRCGMVLDEGAMGTYYGVHEGDRDTGPPQGWPPGETVMASVPGGSFRVLESALRADRDRSDEADCAPIAELETQPAPDCWCGHRLDQHSFAEEPGGGGCWNCGCVLYAPEAE